MKKIWSGLSAPDGIQWSCHCHFSGNKSTQAKTFPSEIKSLKPNNLTHKYSNVLRCIHKSSQKYIFQTPFNCFQAFYHHSAHSRTHYRQCPSFSILVHVRIAQHGHMGLLATTPGWPSGDGTGINCISSALLPTIEYVTKTSQHNPLKFNETKPKEKKRKGKQSKPSLIFILQQACDGPILTVE